MALVTAALISGGISFVSGLFGESAAKKAEKKAADEKAAAQGALDQLIADRQDVINPFEGISNLSSMLSNPMASLGVATRAAEIQVEEADISLANTLDTVRATGASAGGATALKCQKLREYKGLKLKENNLYLVRRKIEMLLKWIGYLPNYQERSREKLKLLQIERPL